MTEAAEQHLGIGTTGAVRGIFQRKWLHFKYAFIIQPGLRDPTYTEEGRLRALKVLVVTIRRRPSLFGNARYLSNGFRTEVIKETPSGVECKLRVRKHEDQVQLRRIEKAKRVSTSYIAAAIAKA